MTGLVYFLQAEMSEALIKIGCTHNLGARLAMLCSCNACQLNVLGIIRAPNARGLERSLHERFASYRHHGEWFKPKRELLRFIEKNAMPPKKRAASNEPPQQWSLDALLDPGGGTPDSEVLTINEVAELLHVRPVTVRRYVDRKMIPFVRVGRQFRFTRHEVLCSPAARVLDLS